MKLKFLSLFLSIILIITVIPIQSIQAKDEDLFVKLNLFHDDLSPDEILNLIYTKARGVFPKINQSYDKWFNLLNLKFDFIESMKIYSPEYTEEYTDKDYETEIKKWFNWYTNGYVKEMPSKDLLIRYRNEKSINKNIYIPDEDKEDSTYIELWCYLHTNYSDFELLKDKLIIFINDYYSTEGYYDSELNEYHIPITNIKQVKHLRNSKEETTICVLDIDLDFKDTVNVIKITLLHPDELYNPSELSKSIIKEPLESLTNTKLTIIESNKSIISSYIKFISTKFNNIISHKPIYNDIINIKVKAIDNVDGFNFYSDIIEKEIYIK